MSASLTRVYVFIRVQGRESQPVDEAFAGELDVRTETVVTARLAGRQGIEALLDGLIGLELEILDVRISSEQPAHDSDRE